jgi:hypothetical protein
MLAVTSEASFGCLGLTWRSSHGLISIVVVLDEPE